jgi:phytoene/squalene synthetase
VIPPAPPPPFVPYPPPQFTPEQTIWTHASALRIHIQIESERRHRHDKEVEEWIAGIPRRMLLGALLAAVLGVVVAAVAIALVFGLCKVAP